MSTISHQDLETITLIIALLCLCGAAYCAYLRNLAAAVGLVLVAVVAFLAAD